MKPLLLCLALLSTVLPAAAAPAPEAGFHDRMVQQAFDHYRLPGIAVGVIEDGKVVHVATRGELAAGEGSRSAPIRCSRSPPTPRR